MKIAVLSRNRQLYSTRRLVEAAQARSHDVVVLDVLRIYMNITSERPSISYKGSPLEGFDAVIPRLGTSVTFYGASVLRQFESTGARSVNDSVAIARARDKLRVLQLLARRGVGLPITGFAHTPDDIADLIDMVGGAPLVIKLLQGNEGLGVVLAETHKAATSVIEAYFGVQASALVQEYIEEANGQTLRCFVIGDRVVASVLCEARPEDFRSNLRSNKTVSARITPAERATAKRAAGVIGLGVCAIDILRSDRGPLVVDVNATPGLRNVEHATGIDIADRIIAFAEDAAN